MDIAQCQAVQTAFLFKAISNHANGDHPDFSGFNYNQFVNYTDLSECGIADHLFYIAVTLEDLKREFYRMELDHVCIAFEYEITEALIARMIALNVFRYKQIPTLESIKRAVIIYFKKSYNVTLEGL